MSKKSNHKKEMPEMEEEPEVKTIEDLYYTKKEPRKAMSTFLRNQNKFIISGVIITDRKATILIRLNSSIISGVIVFQNYIDGNVPLGNLVSIVTIIGMSLSLVLAILAAKPFSRKVSSIFKKIAGPSHSELSHNVFFLLDEVPLDEYEYAMDEVVNSQELQIGNQIRTHYMVNHNLMVTVRLIDTAYSFFLGTFLVVALIFLGAQFF